MPGRLMLHQVNEELSRRGYRARLEKGSGYFYFLGGEATEWLDASVSVRTLNTLTLKQWVEEFQRLKALNEQILRTAKGGGKSGTKAPAR